MLARALVIALCCAYATSLTPLSAAGDDNECALYLTGPGRTSAYDYSLNLLKGNFGYEGQHTCITYDAVNQAYLEARNRIVVSQPKGDWKPEDYASVGELLLDISINLARKYGLTYEEIEKGLPLIDTSRTLIREVCPPIFSHVECRAGKYRRFDGLCTNLQHPTWGATMAPFQRLIGPLFADGINAPRIAHTGRDLPLSRVVSRTMHPDEGFHDHAGTVMVIAWGQFMDHDYTLTGTPLDPVNRNDPEECCKRPPHLKHPYCNEIRVPDDDYFYRLFGVKCIDFVRGFPSPRPGCRLGSRVPFNTLTGVIDGNTVYGVTEKFARKLRTGYGGLLRMNPVFKDYGLKDLLPLKLDIPDEGCTRPNKNMYCFEAGEIRVNEQLVLAVMHTLMAREHNRVAKGLAEVNPHWDDETLFQEARRINIAEIQHITYNEFLPILLGKDVMEKFGLVLEKEGYWNGYDPEVNPDVIDSFAAAAYRFGHSLLPTAVERWSKAHKFIASKRLSDLIRRPYDLYRAGVLDEYVMGLMNQVAQAMDDSITQEVTNHLFKKVGARFGMDLVSFNMQRGREFGLPGYMEFRKFCGLSGADSFQDLFGAMSNDTVRKYETIFEHPIDVDLWSGGVSERPLPGSMLGPTFACIIATQFSYSRRGDRFWFELPNQPSSFTPEQLTELRKARLARIICDNTDIIDTVQLYPMVLPDHELNPRVPCRSGIIPSMDFTKWAEPAPFHGAAKQFITNACVSTANDTMCKPQNVRADLEDHSNNNTISTTQDCNENKKLNSDLQQKPGDSMRQTIQKSSNSVNKTNIVNQDCTSNIEVATNDYRKKLVVNNDMGNNDTILKYVYKKNDKANIQLKTKGHAKNSVNRKRRSNNIAQTDLEPKGHESHRAPLIVNYETSHNPSYTQIASPELKRNRLEIYTNPNNLVLQEPSHIEITLPTPLRTPGKIVNNANLADFNIETLHEIKPQQTYPEIGEYTQNFADKNSKNHSKNSDESEVSRESFVSREDKENKSSEENDKISRQSEKPYKESEESNENSSYRENGELYKESEESNERLTNKENNSAYNDGEERSAYRDGIRSYKESDENIKKEIYSGHNKNEEDKKKHGDDSNESKEQGKFKNQPSQDSYESIEKDNIRDNKKITLDDSKESYEIEEKMHSRNEKLAHSNSRESDKSNEMYAKNKDANSSKYVKPWKESQESDEKLYNSEERMKSNIEERKHTDKFEFPKSNENGDESSIELEPYQKDVSSEYKDKSKENINDNKTNISREDSKDFSYERIQIDDSGKVVPIIKNNRQFDSNSSIGTISLSRLDKVSLPVKSITSPDDSNEDYKRIINIDDGEIKPVVEINGENSDELAEINTKDSSPTELDKEHRSLESVLDIDKQKNDEQYEKLNNEKEDDKSDLKQQFERIPFNYKHDEVKVEQNNENAEPIASQTPRNFETKQIIKSEGTIEIEPVQNPQYDEHLNFKFDDVSVTLPEIKLPDDILDYPYDSTEHQKQKKEKNRKHSNYPYNDYDRDENEKTNKRNHDNFDYENERKYDGYYGGYKKKDNIKQTNEEKDDDDDNDDVHDDDNDNVDLYEKFVRERFGKRGTFAKRFEKLRNDSPIEDNTKLYERVQNILKKTKDVQEQATKSGDPNAGYMWTLEYGQTV